MAPIVAQPTGRPILLLKCPGGEIPPEEWEIASVSVGIGRLDDSQVTLAHRSVSRHHARIVPTPGGYEIEDLGSTNGTWLNDQPLSDRAALADGDNLMVGDVPLLVHLIRQQPSGQAVEYLPAPELPAPGQDAMQAPQVAAPANTGPSTVFYELDDALAAARPSGPARPPADDGPARPPADYKLATPPGGHVQAGPPAEYGAAGPQADYVAARPPAEYNPARPVAPAPPPQPAPSTWSPEAGRPLPSAPPHPPADVGVPRAWDDTPSTRLDLSELDANAATDEHPTLIAGVSAADIRAPQPQPYEARPTAAAAAPPQYDPLPAAPPQPVTPRYDPLPAAPPQPVTPRYDPLPAAPPQPVTPRYDPLPGAPRPPAAAVIQSRPAAPGAPTPVPPAGPESANLPAAALIDLAERLATSLRLLKGDLALATWLFEHAGGAAAAQAFVDQVRTLPADPASLADLARVLETTLTAPQALGADPHTASPSPHASDAGYASRMAIDPRSPQSSESGPTTARLVDRASTIARLVELAPTAAQLLQAAVLLLNVLSSTLDPTGGLDHQAQPDAPDLQPVPRP